MPQCEVRGTKLNMMQLAQTGEGPARDLVLCHGLASSMGFWPVELLDRLRKHFRVTLFDQRGHGRSRPTASGYTAADLGQDLAAFIEAQGLEQPHVMAHSFGGVAALAMLCEAPTAASSLVLLDSQIGLGRRLAANDGTGMDAPLVEALGRVGIDIDPKDPFAGMHLITALAERALSGDPVESDDFRVQFLVQSVPANKAKRWMSLVNDTAAIAEMTGPDGISEEMLARLSLPIFALYGANSPAMHTGNLLSGLLSDCRFQSIEGAGHFFVSSRAAEVADRVLQFWGLEPLEDAA